MESPVRRSKESKKGRYSSDLNNMEHVNVQLKGKLKMLTVEMKDAVERMNSMAAEMNAIKNENFSYKDRVAELEQENALLISQIEEMANERAERDAIIEEFGTAVEARIVEWKNILDEKDTTIAKLKENLMYAASDRLTNASPDERNHAEIERLIQDIDRRDEIIAELQSKLSEAVVEINESSLLIEKFKSDSKTKDASKRATKGERETNKKMQDASKRISSLESLLERAERDAKVKSEQLCEALAILNKYEDEKTSLTNALEEIKELKDQLEKKNRHIEDLIDVVNRLESENSRYEEAIIVLREKLGITEDEEFAMEDLIVRRQQAQEEKIEEIQRSCDQQASENVDLKFQIRKLKTALKESLKNKLRRTNGISSDGENIEDLSHRSESKKDHVELKKMRENVKWVIEENEALRQGMHEILDCIHHQDGKSIVTIQSQTLENLLEALDARHLAGWYHPAMRLQGRVNYLQGSNAELRAQLQQIRKNQMMILEADSQQRSSSVEEGECSQQQTSASSKTDLQPALSQSRNITPKSSENADSGRASGKPADMDEIQRVDDDDVDEPSGSCDTPLDDEGFGKKSEEVYAMAKEMVAQESDFKKALNEAETRQKILEAQVVGLRKNLASYVSPEAHAELRERYLEANMQLRAAFESKFGTNDEDSVEALRSKAVQELRDELVSLHKQLSELALSSARSNSTDGRAVGELEGRLAELKAENERLKKAAEIAHQEALIHRAIDSSVLTEFNDLRQRILKFELNEDTEVKETARLSFELANHKVIVTELREQKKLLERDLLKAREELADLSGGRESEGQVVELVRRPTDGRDYIEIIDFLQHQYAGSTSLSAWERYEASLNKLNNDRNEVKELISQINDQNENLKIQHETLTSRLQIVEQLKDMLEQQIGSNDVQDIMQRFTTESRQLLSESKYKALISQLEEEARKANSKLSDYEKKVASMERELRNAQKAWKVQKASSLRRPASFDKATEAAFKSEKEAKSAQTELKVHSVETQCSLCCKSAMRDSQVEKKDSDESEIDNKTRESDGEAPLKTTNINLLQEQLNQALALASERSVALSKCEAQLTEYLARNDSLSRLLEEKTSSAPVTTNHEEDEQLAEKSGHTSQEALQSSVKSLQKIISQKEETIARYQSLLKEDRDKHSEAAARLHEEIRSLRKSLADASNKDNAMASPNTEHEQPERDIPTGETTPASASRTEETSILREKISRLETELSISAELAERWHRLAEDRLRHMDSTRERLEEQHREEIDSYRMELNKRQRELVELRRQLSENRRAPTTKSEVLSFMKVLQIKDNRLADAIESELEEHAAAVTSQQLSTTYEVEDARLYEFEQMQSQLDNLRRQLQASMERERSYKNEIAELQQRMSRRYMAVKAQEKKASRREMQLDRKVKELEGELSEAKEMLDRQFMVQQAKRAKTAEDLALWEKLKKWQQTAERLKEKLKEKTDECQRLQSNYEKLRALISCMEREKWFLRGKCRSESVPVSAWMPPPPESHCTSSSNNDLLVEELQRECRELRERVNELVARLSRQEEEKRRAASVAFEDEVYTDEEIKRLREVQEILEKENIRLEAENFELRLELERANVNTPRYQEKIQHLEKYVEILKTEKSSELSYPCSAPPRRDGTQRTKAELERTVVTLKKLVEKLQQENKRLRTSVAQSDLGLPAQCNCIYLREDYEQAKQRIAVLETELDLAEKRIAMMEETAALKSDDDNSEEVALLKQQLHRKSELLMKVKDLLSKAASNEKELRHRIQQLEFKQTLSIIPECGSSLA
ncbi:centrosomal protein cep290 [Nasonia vitripennis]|uniref:Uncharacterized protein n=1 Tax=Nasonia vitripennis TaxID=7425 RepID=A0A7M7LUT5_NASVI|nr:centrosomal protein cep290 [Nasonia vitripennis]XP_008211367.1 centrosomal protein cep290 [Nasonia vitripennis]